MIGTTVHKFWVELVERDAVRIKDEAFFGYLRFKYRELGCSGSGSSLKNIPGFWWCLGLSFGSDDVCGCLSFGSDDVSLSLYWKAALMSLGVPAITLRLQQSAVRTRWDDLFWSLWPPDCYITNCLIDPEVTGLFGRSREARLAFEKLWYWSWLIWWEISFN